MKYFLVLNPGSHSGKSRKTFDRLFQLLNTAGIEFEYQITRSLDDAQRISKEMNGEGYDAIIAVGGDGTINGVINGFYDQQGKRRSATKFGVIYTGTSPDFCRSYNIPIKLEEAIERLADPNVINIPVGRITLSNNGAAESKKDTQTEEVRYFACCANIGLGAALARRANGGIRKIFGDFTGTFISLIYSLLTYRANDFFRSIDGNEEKIKKMVNTSVGLTPFIASGIKLGDYPEKTPRSFYCMTVKELKIKHVIPLIRKVYSGKPFKNTPYLDITWCREIEFDENVKNPEVEYDGDPAGHLPCRIDLAQDSLELIA